MAFGHPFDKPKYPDNLGIGPVESEPLHKLYADSHPPVKSAPVSLDLPGTKSELGRAAEYTLFTASTSAARQIGNSPRVGGLTEAGAHWAGKSSILKGYKLAEQSGFKIFDNDGHFSALAKESASGIAKGAGMALSAWGVEYTLDRTVFKNTPEGPVSSAVRWALVPFALNLSENRLAATGVAIVLDVGARVLDKVTNGNL